MTGEEFQRVAGVIKPAVDTAEERFGNRLDRRRAEELGPITGRLDSLEGRMG